MSHSKVSVKYLKKTPSSGKSLISTHSVFWGVRGGRGWGGVGAYLSLSGSGREVGWGGHLLTFSAFRMGAYSNKYGNLFFREILWQSCRGWF